MRFTVNESSYDRAAGAVLPWSMCWAINRPVQLELDARGIRWTEGREPVEHAMNLYASSRTVFTRRPARELAVLMSHGTASKGIRRRIARDFDATIVPSPMHQDEVCSTGTPRDRVPVLGYTKLDWILNPQLREQLEPLPRDDRIRVVYAPTHGGGGETVTEEQSRGMAGARRSTWWRADEIISRLDPDVFDVHHAPHPRYRADRSVTLCEYLNADVVIADGGSTLWEALILGIPLVIPEWITGPAHLVAPTLEGDLYRARAGYMVTDPGRLSRTVLTAAQDGPTPLADHWGLRALPAELRGASAQAHADWIVKARRS